MAPTLCQRQCISVAASRYGRPLRKENIVRESPYRSYPMNGLRSRSLPCGPQIWAQSRQRLSASHKQWKHQLAAAGGMILNFRSKQELIIPNLLQEMEMMAVDQQMSPSLVEETRMKVTRAFTLLESLPSSMQLSSLVMATINVQLTRVHAVGGLMGFLKRKSKMSLLSSALASAILVICGVGLGTPNNRAAAIIALCKLHASFWQTIA